MVIPSKITIDKNIMLPLKLETPTMITYNYDPRLPAGK